MANKTKEPFWILHLALLPLFLGGIALGIMDLIKARKSFNWTPTPAVILSAESSRFGLFSKPLIRYSFSTDKKSHTANKIWVGALTDFWPLVTEKESQKIIERFSPGSEPTVFVNPEDEDESVLFTGTDIGLRWWIPFLFLFFLHIVSIIRLKRRTSS